MGRFKSGGKNEEDEKSRAVLGLLNWVRKKRHLKQRSAQISERRVDPKAEYLVRAHVLRL